MFTRRRVLTGLLALVVAAVAFGGFVVWQVQRDLARAADDVEDLRSALGSRDKIRIEAAVTAFRASSRAASRRTDGPAFGVFTHLPLVGDDARGLQAVSRSLAVVGDDGVPPLADTVGKLEGLVSGGRANLDVVRSLQQPITDAADGFDRAAALIAGLDSSRYVAPLRAEFIRYEDLVGQATSALDSATLATEVAPSLLAEDEPRDYLLLFQDNAEIRAGGGAVGTWAIVHAEDGRLTMTLRGSGTDFRNRVDDPVVPLEPEQVGLYGATLAGRFPDVTGTPDFPQTAEIARAWWRVAKKEDLDGVMSFDYVALSYLLRGAGPVTVRGSVLTSENLVDKILDQNNRELSRRGQARVQRRTVKAVFDKSTGALTSPYAFVRAFSQAAGEGRFRLALFDEAATDALEDTVVLGGLTEDDGEVPHLDVTVDDRTGDARMSYYLRHEVDVDPVGCRDDVATYEGRVSLEQTIEKILAADLPETVTGPGREGLDVGEQEVVVHLFAPYGGELDDIALDGDPVAGVEPIRVGGRRAYSVPLILDGSEDRDLTFTVTTDAGQTDDLEVGRTPGLEPEEFLQAVPSPC